MDRMDEDFGKINPNAPAALSRFAFLIGRWRGEAKIWTVTGESQTYDVAWTGRFLLDGYGIADEYRMTTGHGELIVLGMNFRTYDIARQRWNIRWLNATSGEWTDLVPEELGGAVSFDGPCVTYTFKEPLADHALTRVTYTCHGTDNCTWRGDKSEDGLTWSEFMVVEAYRTG